VGYFGVVFVCRTVGSYPSLHLALTVATALELRWVVKPARDESTLITLIARLNPQCDSFKDLLVVPPFDRIAAHYLREDAPILQRAIRLTELKAFYDSIEKVSARK
jgi:hypothetical protein